MTKTLLDKQENMASTLASLIGEHPGWPVVVMSYCDGEEKTCGSYLQGIYRVETAELVLFLERYYDDEDEFTEDYIDKWWRFDMTDEEGLILAAKAHRLWADNALSCIVVYSDNSLVGLEEIG